VLGEVTELPLIGGTTSSPFIRFAIKLCFEIRACIRGGSTFHNQKQTLHLKGHCTRGGPCTQPIHFSTEKLSLEPLHHRLFREYNTMCASP
jgi:hypothetical protein